MNPKSEAVADVNRRNLQPGKITRGLNRTAVAASEDWKTLTVLPTCTTAARTPDRQDQLLLFQDLHRRQVVADFSDGYLASDGRVLRLRQVDRNLGLAVRLAQVFTDCRDPFMAVVREAAGLTSFAPVRHRNSIAPLHAYTQAR